MGDGGDVCVAWGAREGSGLEFSGKLGNTNVFYLNMFTRVRKM